MGGAFHAQTDSSLNQTMMSPRFLRARSYAGQFFTRYFVLYFGDTLVFLRAAISESSSIMLIHNGNRIEGAICDVKPSAVHQRLLLEQTQL